MNEVRELEDEPPVPWGDEPNGQPGTPADEPSGGEQPPPDEQQQEE